MKKLYVIGIGAGNPDYITVQAIAALNAVDVFFFLDKGDEKSDLVRLRKEICERFITDSDYRFVEVPSPERDAADGYKPGVHAWHRKKAEIYAALIRDELADGECGAILVWGDPSLYDSTLRVLHHILAEGLAVFDYEVIPGISSVQSLAARHRIALNEIGEAIHVTTGRKLAEGLPANAESVVVMLDGGPALRSLAAEDVEIHWGAYLGTPDEVLVSGRLCDVIDDIEKIRRTGKADKGWIMDTYLLRRPRS